MNSLSHDHPLLENHMKPWPYKVVVGYRRPGSRTISGHRSIYIRASGEEQARLAGIKKAREMMPMLNGKERLIASRIVSSRPLDKQDAVGGAQ